MTLKGLPESPLPAGAVTFTSFISVLVCTAGLALLRSTRPSNVEQLQRAGARYGGLPPCLVYNVLGIFGALLYFIGLVFGSIPMLMGVATDDEGKAAAIIQCTQVLLCWAVERYKLLGHALPPLQSCACAIVWFGSTLVEWAGPRPYDNIRLGLQSQVSGCDGGYRSPFLVYAACWLTCTTFGIFFLFCEEGPSPVTCTSGGPVGSEEVQASTSLEGSLASVSSQHAKQPEGTKVLTRKALPVIYGFVVSMSGISFALGTSTNDMMWVCFAALLQLAAVVCAWEWLWSVELSLSSWASLSHCAATMIRLGQTHLIFRDFRWDPESVYGILVVWKWPGLALFLVGFFLLFFTGQIYNNTCHWKEWGSSSLADSQRVEPEPTDKEGVASELALPPGKPPRVRYLLHWLLLPVCITCLVIGISIPLIETDIFLPAVTWLYDEAAIERFERSTRPGIGHHIKSGRSYLDLISSLYAGRLPCSALVVAYNSVIMPPLQFLGIIVVLLGKQRSIAISDELLKSIQTWLANQAPSRFTNPMILMTMVGFINLTAPSGKMKATFTRGYWFYVSYCILLVLLSWSLNAEDEGKPSELEASRNSPADTNIGDMKIPISKSSRIESEDNCEDDYSDLESEGSAPTPSLGAYTRAWEIAGIFCMVPVTAVAMYLAISSPFLSFEYRLSGITIKQSEPTVFELWQSLGERSRLLSYFAAITMILLMPLWLMLLGLRALAEFQRRPGRELNCIGRTVKFLELTARPWVMGHIWAFSLMLIYYIVTARNKAPIEVCTRFPKRPIGLIAIAVMGGCVKSLHELAKQLVAPLHAAPPKGKLSLPGGTWTWGVGAVIVGTFWLVILFSHGPTLEPEIASLDDVNTVLSKILPVTNRHLHMKIPESAGDCEELWEHRIKNGEALYAKPQSEVMRHCSGHRPLSHIKKRSGHTNMEVTAKWATGLNTLEIMDILIMPPTNVTEITQQWNMTVTAKFSDLHVWLKVVLGDEEWINDYMCCDTPFHFTIQASVQCTLGFGFHPMQLNVLHMDHIEFVHRVEVGRSQGFSASYHVDYGRSEMVEHTIMNLMTGKTGKFLIKNSDGSTTDPLASASNVLNDIVFLNTGQQCLYEI